MPPVAGTHTVVLDLICRNPPVCGEHSTTEFGLQDKQQNLHPGEPQSDGSVAFHVTVEASYHAASDSPRFRGAHVHGPATDQFLYLGLRPIADPPAPWIKRLKIRLSSITWQQIEQQAQTGGCFRGTVDGTRAGSVPLVEGAW